jgi:flagellin-like protein
MKALMKKGKGVSEVIGTILMVALTVVAVAVVLMYVGGYFTGAPNNPQALLMDEKNVYSSDFSKLTAVFTVTQGSLGTPFMIKIVNQTNGALIAGGTVSALSSVTETQLTLSTTSVKTISYIIYDNNKNGKFDTGDSLNIVFSSGTPGKAINTSIVDQWTVEITCNGGVIYSYNLTF